MPGTMLWDDDATLECFTFSVWDRPVLIGGIGLYTIYLLPTKKKQRSREKKGKRRPKIPSPSSVTFEGYKPMLRARDHSHVPFNSSPTPMMQKSWTTPNPIKHGGPLLRLSVPTLVFLSFSPPQPNPSHQRKKRGGHANRNPILIAYHAISTKHDTWDDTSCTGNRADDTPCSRAVKKSNATYREMNKNEEKKRKEKRGPFAAVRSGYRSDPTWRMFIQRSCHVYKVV